jgi:alkylation response protein AidB-like acyl-CoA dehydrogenase
MTPPPAAYQLLERFEEVLGDPRDDGQVFSLAACVALDEREEFPAEICRALDAAGVPGFYVPERLGGRLRRLEEVFQLFRLVARRDLTAAVAHHKTFLGAVSTWVAGRPEQARELAEEVLSGTVVSWALTEAAHGSDLLASGLVAEPTAYGYRLTGEKWLINNATRADLITVLASTEPEAGARGLSLLLVDKRLLPAGSYRELPPVRTHGIRGADISGIAFDGAVVPYDAVIGEPGQGLEIVLKGFQLTRTLCAALTLGAVDRGLRLALEFALEHRVYGSGVADLPQSRRMLTEAYADLLAAEALGLFAARAAQALPGELSTASAVSKYLVPTIGDETLTRLGQLLGARAFLRGTFAHGVFQKVERDHRIVGIFDGSTVVNLNTLVSQFPFLARGARRAAVDEAGLGLAADPTAELPELDPALFQLVPRGGASVVNALPNAVARIAQLAADGRLPGEVRELAEEVLEHAGRAHAEMADHRPSPTVSAEAFSLAERYCAVYAAAVCIQLWLAGAGCAPKDGPAAELWIEGRWLRACLTRLLGRLRPSASVDREAVLDELFPALRAQYAQGRLLSLLDCRIAEESA